MMRVGVNRMLRLGVVWLCITHSLWPAQAQQPEQQSEHIQPSHAHSRAEFQLQTIDSALHSETDKAIGFYRAKIARNPYQWTSYEELGKAYLRKARHTSDFAWYAKAEQALRQSLTLQASNASSHTYLAYTLLSQHRFKEATTHAHTAVALQAQNSENGQDSEKSETLGIFGTIFGILGDADLEVGAYEKARVQYQKLLERQEHPVHYTRMSRLEYLTGHTRAASQALEKAIQLSLQQQLSPENFAWCRVSLGSLYFETGKRQEAEEQYREALKLYPGYFLALEHLAELRATQQDYPTAMRLYETVIKTHPLPAFFLALGDVYTELGRPEEAKAQYDQAVRKYTDFIKQGSQAHLRSLALFYLAREIELPTALELARKDLEIRQDIYAYDTLAWAAYKNGQFAEARLAVQQALRLGTQDAQLFYHAGMIFYAVDELAAAQEYLQRALSLKPYFPDAQGAAQTLNAITRQRSFSVPAEQP